MSTSQLADVVVIGGGIAGAACGYQLGKLGLQVVVLERESEMGQHSTGRSAATLVPGYGGAANDDLTHLGADFFRSGGDGLSDYPLLTPRPLLLIEPIDLAGRHHVIDGARHVEADEATIMCAAIRPNAVARYWVQDGGFDIDVSGTLAALVRGAKAAGVEFGLRSEVVQIGRTPDGWHVGSGGRDYRCRLLVNAAGAWADRIAEIAGVEQVGLAVLKRTAFVSRSEAATPGMPLVLTTDSSCYFKPDVPGMVLCSLSDEAADVPGSPVADEADVAYAIDRINSLTTLGIRSVARAWAGLRVFGPDREPVVRQDRSRQPFVWCAGLGGTGIQTSPGAGLVVAQLAASILR